MFKYLSIALLALSFNVNAAYVDVVGENYFLNDSNGQQWLDLTGSFRKSVDTALADNSGYRIATKDEVDDLLGAFFRTNYGTSIKIAVSSAEAQAFEAVVGSKTVPYRRGGNDIYAIGLYEDTSILSGDNIKFAGTRRHNDGTNSLYTTNYSQVFANDLIVGTDRSVWLVTDVPSVPVPAAVWLFGSGLIGLVAVARRKA